MWIEETRWTEAAGWRAQKTVRKRVADLVVFFGNRDALRCGTRYAELRAAYPTATIVGCSGVRSIIGNALEEHGIVAAALGFANTPIRLACEVLTERSASRAAGRSIGQTLAGNDLAGVLVLADGLRVDGSELTGGLCESLGSGPLIVGGMASDPRDFSEALVGADCGPRSGLVAAVGFYGDSIRFAHGSASGFDAFGPRRCITRSVGNVLYELDGKPPFELYRRYLGDELARGISEEGVIYPLLISPPEFPDRTLVRAPLACDVGAPMTFAGHMPQGWIARLMRGHSERLIRGAAAAAREALVGPLPAGGGEILALLVSCAGRHKMMGQRTEEELEAVGDELGDEAKRIGFYSYGEIAPLAHSGISEVHNETMSITTLFEAVG